jgi:hypothetical protein
MAIALPDHPAGRPIGPGWRADTGTAPVVFPYDGGWRPQRSVDEH